MSSRGRAPARRSAFCSAASMVSSAGWYSPGRCCSPCRCGASTSRVPNRALLELRDRVALVAQQLEHAALADEVQRAYHHERVVVAVEQLFHLRQPVPVAVAHERLVERGEVAVFGRQQRGEPRGVAVTPGTGYLLHLRVDALELIDGLIEHANLILARKCCEAAELLLQRLEARGRLAVLLRAAYQLFLDALLRIETLVL